MALSAFTLIELLVVITIVAVLVGIALPIFTKMQNMSGKVQAVNDMRNIKVAILNYYTDYRKYPLNSDQIDAVGNANDDTVYGDPVNPRYQSSLLFDILRAQSDGSYNANNALNPSLTVYWPGQIAKSPNHPRSGITTVNVNNSYNSQVYSGSLVDPWGNAYVVWFDANKDGDLSVATNWFYSDVSTAIGTVHPGIPPLGVTCASMGPDGKWGTNGNNILAGSDDIVTWQ